MHIFVFTEFLAGEPGGRADLRFRRAALVLLLLCGGVLHGGSAQTAASEKQSFQQAVATGSEALQKGENANAERAFRQALALDPDSVPLLNNLAIAVARQQREAEAISLYKHALQLMPGDPVTQRNLGLAYFSAHDYTAALPFLQSFAKGTPTFLALEFTGLDLFALNRYREAAHYLEAAHALRPTDIETLNMLGKAYMRQKNYSGVTQVFNQIMAINPNSPEAHMMMAMAYDQLFREADAIREFEAALALAPNYPGIHTGLGVIYWRNDNVDAAEREFREELSHYPNDPIANYTLGRILEDRNKYVEAAGYLEAALAVNPSYREALLTLGKCRLALNQPAAAIAALQKEIALNPNDAEAHYMLGSAFNQAGQPAEGARQRLLCAKIRSTQRQQQQTGMSSQSRQ